MDYLMHLKNTRERYNKEFLYLKEKYLSKGLSDEEERIDRIIICYGNPMILDKTIDGERIKIEGVIKLSIIYKIVNW